MAYSQAHPAMATHALIPRLVSRAAANENKLLFGLAAISAMLGIIANRRGIGISWDSTDYIAVGLSLSEGRGALDVTGKPMVIRPPGLSLFVAAGDRLGVSPSLALVVVNAVSMAIVVWCTHRLLVRTAARRAAVWIGVALVAVSPSLLDIFSMAWSEPPFIALILVALLIATREREWPWEFVLAATFTAMFFVRYTGPFYAAPIALVAAVVQVRKSGLLLGFLRGGTVLAVSLVAPWLWLMRNKELSGYLTGYRVAGGGTLLDPFKTFTATLGSWLVGRAPLQGNGGIYLNWNDYSALMQTGGVMIWIAVVAVVIAYFSRTRRHPREATIVLSACLWLVVFYGGFSVYRFVYDEMGPLDSRMMSGLYVPMVILLVAGVDHITMQTSRTAQRTARVAATFALVVIAWHSAASVRDAVRYGDEGRHWGSLSHQLAPIHLFARGLPDDAALFSNEPQSLFAASYRWPIRNQYMNSEPALIPCRQRYFFWYNTTFLPDGKPVGGTLVFSDATGEVIDLGTCDSDISIYWP